MGGQSGSDYTMTLENKQTDKFFEKVSLEHLKAVAKTKVSSTNGTLHKGRSSATPPFTRYNFPNICRNIKHIIFFVSDS